MNFPVRSMTSAPAGTFTVAAEPTASTLPSRTVRTPRVTTGFAVSARIAAPRKDLTAATGFICAEKLQPATTIIKMRATLVILSICLIIVFWSRNASSVTTFQPYEATIAQTHELLRAGKVTCREITEAYLKRIAAYDQSKKLNS